MYKVGDKFVIVDATFGGTRSVIPYDWCENGDTFIVTHVNAIELLTTNTRLNAGEFIFNTKWFEYTKLLTRSKRTNMPDWF